MKKILMYFISEIINSAESFGLSFTKSKLHKKDLIKDSFRVFEIQYYGHAAGFFRIVVDQEILREYTKALKKEKGTQELISLFYEMMETALTATIKNFEDFEHCTAGLPRSFHTPIFEPEVQIIEESIYDNNCKGYLNIYLHHDSRKTDLSKVLEEEQKEKEKITLKAEKLEEEKLSLNAQKFEAIGQLAAGVAHEINTPIQFVSDNINFLKESFKKFLNNIDNLSQADLDFYIEEIPAALDESREGLLRISEIIKSLKEFSHPGNDKIQLYPIKQLIKNCISLTKNEFKYVSKIKTDIEDLKVKIYPNKLSQVLVNLIVNSTHSIRDKFQGKKQGLISIRFYKEKEDFVFELEDNGGGIKQEYVDKVFDPFFTTKIIGEGTGQGLSISKTIIEKKHNGTISILKNSEDGLCFKVVIKEPKNE